MSNSDYLTYNVCNGNFKRRYIFQNVTDSNFTANILLGIIIKTVQPKERKSIPSISYTTLTLSHILSSTQCDQMLE